MKITLSPKESSPKDYNILESVQEIAKSLLVNHI